MGGGDGFKMFRYNDKGILCIIFRNLVCVCVCVGGGGGREPIPFAAYDLSSIKLSWHTSMMDILVKLDIIFYHIISLILILGTTSLLIPISCKFRKNDLTF